MPLLPYSLVIPPIAAEVIVTKKEMLLQKRREITVSYQCGCSGVVATITDLRRLSLSRTLLALVVVLDSTVLFDRTTLRTIALEAAVLFDTAAFRIVVFEASMLSDKAALGIVVFDASVVPSDTAVLHIVVFEASGQSDTAALRIVNTEECTPLSLPE